MNNLNEPRSATPGEPTTIPVEPRDHQSEPSHLLAQQQVDDFHSRWTTVQTSFIDEPRRAVKDADDLVLAAIKQLSDAFSNQRNQLERQWSRGDEVSTEDLRLALQQYRSFFSRLLSI